MIALISSLLQSLVVITVVVAALAVVASVVVIVCMIVLEFKHRHYQERRDLLRKALREVKEQEAWMTRGEDGAFYRNVQALYTNDVH